VFKFISSVFDSEKLAREYYNEILILGRSNVGKSSFINNITQSSIAISSKTPGRTKCLNFFTSKKKNLTIIDSPGYGFAKVSIATQESWLKLIESALNREFLKYIIILIDARRGFMDSDKILLDNIYNKTNAEIILVSTKNDKREAKDLVSDKFKVFKISNTKKHNIKDIQRYLKL